MRRIGTYLTTVKSADGVGVSVEGTGATVTFASLDLDGIGKEGVISGVALDNPGILTINGGSIANTGAEGLRFGSAVNGVNSATVSNVTFTAIGGFVAEAGNSGLSGSGNVAVPFSCNDLGGNTGFISFNGGADSCP